jgi:UDP-2-acetamido-2,6-beta-L-arabino-hexul-4-ose reductase
VTVITGGFGFLGWHLACRLRALEGVIPTRLGRDDFADPARLAQGLGESEVVYHVAGVNRAPSDDDVERGNEELAQRLASALRAAGRPRHVVYADSIHARTDTPYGRGKRRAAELLAEAASDVGGSFADVLLPNLFGEHGRPGYNSFVATFCHEVAHGRSPTVTNDRTVPLLHAQAAAQALMDAAAQRSDAEVVPTGTEHRISRILELINRCHVTYARGELPPLETEVEVDIFNTYRSFLFPQHYPFATQVHEDARGRLFETVRAHGGTTQAFVSTTLPGQRRGDHYHLRKIERFFVVKGEAEIALRRLYGDELVTFRVSGTTPAFVDMPTMWVHNITNVGDDELVTMFWADQLLDRDNPDQFPEVVEVAS